MGELFERVRNLACQKSTLVCLFIDEVESIVMSRQGQRSEHEPTDSIRVVNTILREIDRLKTFPNVLILTTSNLVGCLGMWKQIVFS